MIDLGDRLEKDFCHKFLGEEVEVLFETKDEEGYYEGYTSNYIHFKLKSDINLENKLEKHFVQNVFDKTLYG